MKNLVFFAACLIIVSLSFVNTFATSEFPCSSPQNVTKVAETSSSISFDWDDRIGSTFQVYYVKNGRASNTYQTNSSNFTFSNLEAGAYEFYFFSDCGGVSSNGIIIADVIEQ